MGDEAIPPRVLDNLSTFHEKLTNLEDVMRPVLATSLEKCHENMTPLEKAKLDLVTLYAANSLFWIYLSTKGTNPKEYPVVHELERVKKYMDKVKEIEDKVKAPKLHKESAKRFLRNALFDPENDEKLNDPPSTSSKDTIVDNRRADELNAEKLKNLTRECETSSKATEEQQKNTKRKEDKDTKNESRKRRR